MTYIRGQVARVIHTSGTFHVLVMNVLESSGYLTRKSTRVTGDLLGIEQVFRGLVLEVHGDWVEHAKYGHQFRVTTWKPWARNSLDVEVFFRFAAAIFDDMSVMERFVELHECNAFAVLADGPLAGADETVLASARERWREIRAVATLAESLREFDLSAPLIAAVAQKFGSEAPQILAENPYRLVEIEGLLFKRVDEVARSRGIMGSDERRLTGATLWAIREQTRQQGHLYLSRADLPVVVTDLLSRADLASLHLPDMSAAVSDALLRLVCGGLVRVDGGAAVYCPELFTYERSGAAMLSRFLTPVELVLDLPRFLADYQSANGVVLSDLQRAAVSQLISNRVLVVTGAPGTGKTTLVKAFVHLFRSLQISHLLVAPTGIAAKRLAHVTGASASTIHRALKYDGHRWGHGGDLKLEVRAVIVDEMSMVDQEVFYRLLDALEPTTMLVLVGDDAQLPSVGPGNVLRELIACKHIPTIRLETIFRQAESSDIVLAAHMIRRGQSPLSLPRKQAPEFEFVPIADEATIAEVIVRMAVKLKARDANFQVLSPKYEGMVGVNNLNARLRDALNPDIGQPSWEMFGLHVRLGDRVMIIKNNYNLNVYNGDIGKLIGLDSKSLTIRIHGLGSHPETVVDIPRDKAPLMLRLAYALTVHKSQGEEFETVIVPLVRTQGRMLQRNLFYTAITRARSKVWLLGEADAVDKAVVNARVQQRNTVFGKLIAPVNPCPSVP